MHANEQTHKTITCTEGQTHKEMNVLTNNPTNPATKTVLILSALYMYTSPLHTGLDKRYGFINNFLQGWVSINLYFSKSLILKCKA
jgi:hypothetical protein